MEQVFIRDIREIRAFIETEKQKKDYFEHVMDSIMSKHKA